jgi:hypothetical protein
VIGLTALVALFVLASRAAYGGNSDDATLVLQGQSMAAGHLTLSGWDLSYDAFWTSEVPFYAFAVAAVGAREEVMYLVPAVVGVLLVVVAAWLALGARGRGGEGDADPLRTGDAAARGGTGDARRAGRLPGVAGDLATLVPLGLVVALLALPSPALSYFLLQGGWHAVTALWCLVAFAGIARSSGRLGLVVAIVFLAAGLLGDLLTAVLAVAPLLVAGAVATRRCGTWRAGYRYVVAVVGGLLLAGLGRLIALQVGTYSIGSRSVFAAPSQVLRNIASIPDRIAGMLGVTDVVPGVPSSPWPLRLAHLLLLVVVLAALVLALTDLVRAKAGRDSTARGGSAASQRGQDDEWRLDDLLSLAVIADFGGYALFATDGNIALARYLVPGVVFAVVLAARLLGRLVRRHRQALGPWPALAGLAVLALCALDFGIGSIRSAAPQEARPLATFLAEHHLRAGIGDYWSSSIVTVDSAGAVAVRPVQLGPHDALVRYDKQSSAAWYRDASFRFFVSDTANPWQGVTSAAAVRAFGAPARVYDVGTYRVLVWTHALRLGS